MQAALPRQPSLFLMRDDDDTLIDGFVGGDSAALRVVDSWIEVVLRREYRGLSREWDDLRQEVRTRVFRNLSRGAFRGDSDLRTYVHQITKNVCVDQLRGRQRDALHLAEMPAKEVAHDPPAAQPHAARDLLRHLLGGLSARERRLLHLVHVERLPYAQVARQLNISEGAVKLRMYRCRRRVLKLRRRLLRLKEWKEGLA